MCFEINVPIIEISIQLTILRGQFYAYRLIDESVSAGLIAKKNHFINLLQRYKVIFFLKMLYFTGKIIDFNNRICFRLS